MAVRNGSLILDHGYANYPPAGDQPSRLSSTSEIPQHRRGEFPAVVRTEPTDTEITTGQSKKPQFLKSIDELASFSAAVDTFKRQFDDLQKHIESIENAIDSNLNTNGIDLAASSSSLHPPQLSPPRNIASEEKTNLTVIQSAETVPETSNKPERERLCELMCSKGMRRYINANISDRAKLMEEIPAALKRAKEPAKFVLECIGKFYLQGRRAFTKESPMVSARKVSLLILECFLLMPDDPAGDGKGKIKIASSVKDEAETASVAWRKRLMSEGELASAEKMDARGLLLLVACFGVPSKFKSMDLLDLIRRSGSNEIAIALKRSPFLVPMISGIVESSIKRGMHLEALEIVYTFGMEDKFSPSSFLTSFLKMKDESFEKAKRKAQSPVAFKEAAEKQIAALSSVIQCMETHRLDPAKEVPAWQIKEQIVNLEKDISQLNKEMEEKARSISLMEEAVLAKRLYNQPMKRPRLSPMEMAPVASSSYASPIYRDRSYLSHIDEDRDEISALVSSYLGPPSSFPHRSSLRRSPEYMVPPGGLGRSIYEHLPSSTYSPVHTQRLPRQYTPPIHGQQQQQQQQHIPFGLQRVYRQSPSNERYLDLPNHRSRSPRNSSLDR